MSLDSVVLESPSMDDAASGSKTVRLHGDLADMLQQIRAWRSRGKGRFSSVEFLDPLVRPAITAEYRKVRAEMMAEDEPKPRRRSS